MVDASPMVPGLVLPVGTQVVTGARATELPGDAGPQDGTVGVVVRAPLDNTQPYGVRFLDGTDANLHRQEFAVRKEVRRAGFREAGATAAELYDSVIYRCVVGSRAYGLDEPSSDMDRRGIYLPPAELHWSLCSVPEHLEGPQSQDTYWEIQKFLTLALKANPNVLECLYTPLIELATPPAEELLAIRSIFLSRLVYQTYNGYVMSQFKKLEQDLRTTGAFKWKHAMHLIRLLLSGVTVLREGFVPLQVGPHRERLLTIRRGEVPWEEVNAWRLSLHGAFDAALAATRLPERPNYERANAFLIEARRSMV